MGFFPLAVFNHHQTGRFEREIWDAHPRNDRFFRRRSGAVRRDPEVGRVLENPTDARRLLGAASLGHDRRRRPDVGLLGLPRLRCDRLAIGRRPAPSDPGSGSLWLHLPGPRLPSVGWYRVAVNAVLLELRAVVHSGRRAELDFVLEIPA